MGVGGCREQPDDAQLAGHLAIRSEPLDADIVHVGATVDHGLDVGLGDDEEVRPLQEFQDLGRGGDGILAQPQNPNVGIGEDAETAPLATFHRRRRTLAGIDVFAHPEESKIVVAQPVNEGKRLVPIGLLSARGIGTELFCGTLQEIQHRCPVGDRQMNLLQDVADPADQRLCVRIRKGGQVDLDQTDVVCRIAGVVAGTQNRLGSRLQEQNRMDSQIQVAVAGRDLAHHGIEEEWHVPVDHRQNPGGLAIRFDAFDGLKRDGRSDPGPVRQAICRMGCRGCQHIGRIALDIVTACPPEQDEWVEEGPRPFRSDLPRGFDLLFPFRVLPAHVILSVMIQHAVANSDPSTAATCNPMQDPWIRMALLRHRIWISVIDKRA